MKKLFLVARILLGLIFTVFGLNGFFHFIPAPELSGTAADFLGAMVTSHMLMVVKALEVISGVLLLIGKKVPLALTLLTPIVINIFLFHLLMDPANMAMAIVVLVLDGLLLYANREVLGKVVAAP